MRFQLPIFFLLMMTACVGTGDRERGEWLFPQEQTLTSCSLRNDSLPSFRYPFRVRIHNGMVLLHDLHNDDCFLHAFSFPGLAPIASFGKRGAGPGELTMVENIRFVAIDSIWVLDSGRGELTRWGIDPENHRAEQLEVVKIDRRVGRAYDFDLFNSRFLIPSSLGDGRFYWLNQRGELEKTVGEIPARDPEALQMPKPALAQAWRSFIHYCPETGGMVLATQLGEILEVVHADSSRLFRGAEGEPRFGLSNGYAIPNGIMGFCDIQLTPTRIYALFQGTPMKEIIRQFQQGETPEAGGRLLYVFDSAGTPLVKYRLDVPLSGFTVDEPAGILVGLNVNSDDPIVTFRLP